MGINPGNPAFAAPPAEDDLSRQIKDLERTVRENLASVASSFRSTVAALVVPKAFHAATDNFLLSDEESLSPIVSATVDVPTGYTTALVSATAILTAYNSTAVDTSLAVQVGVTGQNDEHHDAHGAAQHGQNGGASDAYAWVVTPLDSTIIIGCYGYVTSGTFDASQLNQATVSGTVLFVK